MTLLTGDWVKIKEEDCKVYKLTKADLGPYQIKGFAKDDYYHQAGYTHPVYGGEQCIGISTPWGLILIWEKHLYQVDPPKPTLAQKEKEQKRMDGEGWRKRQDEYLRKAFQPEPRVPAPVSIPKRSPETWSDY